MANLFYKERFIIASTSPVWIDIGWRDEFGRHSHIIRNPNIRPSADKTAEDCLLELAKKWIDAHSPRRSDAATVRRRENTRYLIPQPSSDGVDHSFSGVLRELFDSLTRAICHPHRNPGRRLPFGARHGRDKDA
ncbi:MAG TPA: hypothetical protein VFU31_23525 [Candidatus Binatia bacterium]|nr:hypothetical protein [Candidatus Binatia bacterium]